MKNVIYVLMIILFSCSTSKVNVVNKKDLDCSWLLGTWKIVDKEDYEKWSKISPTEFMGVSYDMSLGTATIKENMRIYKSDKNWIYEAKLKVDSVMNSTAFIRNADPIWNFRFVNEKHDFPQIIQYKMNADSSMTAQILDLKASKVINFNYLKVKSK